MFHSFLFKIPEGSRSERGNEEAGGGLSQGPGDKKSGHGNKVMGSSDDSDTESVESDEMAKLQTETADLADMETEEASKDFVAMF